MAICYPMFCVRIAKGRGREHGEHIDGTQTDVRFVCPEEACLRVAAGATFILWVGRTTGEGKILESYI